MVVVVVASVVCTRTAAYNATCRYGVVVNGVSFKSAYLWPHRISDIGKCYGVLCFGLALNCIIPSSYLSLDKKERMGKLTTVSIGAAILLYIVMGVMGTGTFGSGLETSIMMNIDHQSPWYCVATVVLCLTLVLMTPIIVYPSALTIEAWFVKNDPQQPREWPFPMDSRGEQGGSSGGGRGRLGITVSSHSTLQLTTLPPSPRITVAPRRNACGRG